MTRINLDSSGIYITAYSKCACKTRQKYISQLLGPNLEIGLKFVCLGVESRLGGFQVVAQLSKTLFEIDFSINMKMEKLIKNIVTYKQIHFCIQF